MGRRTSYQMPMFHKNRPHTRHIWGAGDQLTTTGPWAMGPTKPPRQRREWRNNLKFSPSEKNHSQVTALRVKFQEIVVTSYMKNKKGQGSSPGQGHMSRCHISFILFYVFLRNETSLGLIFVPLLHPYPCKSMGWVPFTATNPASRTVPDTCKQIINICWVLKWYS